MDNIATKPSSYIYGSVNGLSDKNIQHEPYISSDRYVMSLFPRIRGQNFRGIEQIG